MASVFPIFFTEWVHPLGMNISSPNAIIAMRYDTAELYGTAVVI